MLHKFDLNVVMLNVLCAANTSFLAQYAKIKYAAKAKTVFYFFYLKLFKYYKILQQLLIDIHKIPN